MDNIWICGVDEVDDDMNLLYVLNHAKSHVQLIMNMIGFHDYESTI